MSAVSVRAQSDVQPVNELQQIRTRRLRTGRRCRKGGREGDERRNRREVDIDRDSKVNGSTKMTSWARETLILGLRDVWKQCSKFDASGKLLKSFGEGDVHVPARHLRGQARVTSGSLTQYSWRCGQTAAGRGHIVVKFSPEGKVLLTLGKLGDAWRWTRYHSISRPTSVTAPNGDIFVADGHGGNTNARM